MHPNFIHNLNQIELICDYAFFTTLEIARVECLNKLFSDDR